MVERKELINLLNHESIAQWAAERHQYHIERLTQAFKDLASGELTEEEFIKQEATLHVTADMVPMEDPVTRLATRVYFERRYPEAIAVAERNNEPLSVIMLDVDRLKIVNDEHGHLVGDGVLTALGGLILENVRGVDVPARYGGDEFVIILPRTDENGAINVAVKIKTAIDMQGGLVPVGHETKDVIYLTVSMGVAQWERGEPPRKLLGRADEMLYEVKKRGRKGIMSPTILNNIKVKA